MSWQCPCGAYNEKGSLACEACGHEPNVVPTGEKARPNFGIYREVPDRTAQVHEPLTPEIKAMLTTLKHQLEVVAPAVRAKAVETFKRCPACETGRFVHLGTRFCLACYSTL